MKEKDKLFVSDSLGEEKIVKNEVLMNVQRLRIEESPVTIIHCEGDSRQRLYPPKTKYNLLLQNRSFWMLQSF